MFNSSTGKSFNIPWNSPNALPVSSKISIGITPKTVDCFVVTNYTIGTGASCQLPSPILLEEHYLQLMQNDVGMQHVHKALHDKKKCTVGEIKKRYARYRLVDFKIKIPETLMVVKGGGNMV